MYIYINKQIKLHCEIYNQNFDEILYNYNNSKKNNELSEQLINIYNKEELKSYEETLNSIFNSIKKINSKLNKVEHEKFNQIKFKEKFGDDFLEWFISFSFLKCVIYEKYNTDKRIEKKNIESYELTNAITNDICFFIDFLYVHKKINSTSDSYNKIIFKKTIFRLIIDLKESILKINKKTVLNEATKKIRYANFIEFKEKSSYKSTLLLFKISKEPATIKERNDIKIIGFKHYLLNTYLVTSKIQKKNPVINQKFTKLLSEYAKTSFFFDKQMFQIVEKELTKIKSENIDEILKKLQSKYTQKNIKIIDSINIDDTINNLSFLKYQIKKIQKNLSLNIEMWIFEKLKQEYEDYDGPIYFIPYADFRGRIYYKSMISPQSGWIFRFLYNFGNIDKVEYEDLNMINLDRKLEDKIQEINKSINFKIFSWIFLSIGFKFKKEIIGSKKSVDIEKFIEKGLEKYNVYKNCWEKIWDDEKDRMDAIEIIYYITLVKSLEEDKPLKRYIIKDTTASIYQHLGKVLIFKNYKALELTNLMSNFTWFDTYDPIINYLLKFIDEEVKEFFTRKTLKKILMTTKYNIGFESALSYFNGELEFINDKEKYRLIIKNFYRIYKMLKKGDAEEEILFKKSIEDFNSHIVTLNDIEFEDIKINLTYFKMKKFELCIFVDKQRYTMIDYRRIDEKDDKKILSSSLPHVIHALDALYARKIFKILNSFNINLFTIHDAFAIPFNQIEILILAAWDSIDIDEQLNFTNESNKKEIINSVTILI